MMMSLSMIIINGCAAKEILPNLCFDGEETYMCGIMCNEDNSVCIDLDNPDLKEEIEKKEPIYLEPIRNLDEHCESWLPHMPEAYMNCILIA